LGAERGRLVLLEQPELHLHPKVQARLGDFLASARPDIRLLVETHSEYLITRLRRRVAEGVVSGEELAVLFVKQRVVEHVIEEDGEEATEKEIFSEFRRLSLDEHGDFNAWPEDFFDALEGDTVHLAEAVMRRLGSSSADS
jgi:predicted ATPase